MRCLLWQQQQQKVKDVGCDVDVAVDVLLRLRLFIYVYVCVCVLLCLHSLAEQLALDWTPTLLRCCFYMEIGHHHCRHMCIEMANGGARRKPLNINLVAHTHTHTITHSLSLSRSLRHSFLHKYFYVFIPFSFACCNCCCLCACLAFIFVTYSLTFALCNFSHKLKQQLLTLFHGNARTKDKPQNKVSNNNTTKLARKVVVVFVTAQSVALLLSFKTRHD